MDENTKARLDELALDLQRSEEAAASDLSGRDWGDRNRDRSHRYQGRIEGFAEAISRLNQRFGTRYEDNSFLLREYFKVPEKPCERR